MHRTCVAVLGAAMLAVAGCGGSDDPQPAAGSDGPDTAAPPLTKAQFIAKADGICREVNTAHKPYADKVDALPRGTDLRRVAPLLEGALMQSRKGLARLRALPAPAEGEAALEAYYVAAERVLEAHARLADAARRNDRPAGEKVARTTTALSDDERRLGSAYGLEDCNNVF